MQKVRRDEIHCCRRIFMRTVPPLTDFCNGCAACAAACPLRAVRMTVSAEGFYLPVTDEERCTRCGACGRHCAVVSGSVASNRPADRVKTYAAWVSDRSVREESSSGGMFTALARDIVAAGGTVFGAVWDKDWSVMHAAANNEEQIGLCRGSKYLPSRMEKAYVEAVKYLKSKGGPVLFVGLPCQVAALRTFVEDDRLLAVDLACHGTPSLSVFHAYLASLAGDRTVTRVNFRDKRTGWSRFSLVISFGDGTEYVSTFRDDPFMIGFLSNLYSNCACYDCPFCSMPRQGDLTLADYWGVAKEYKSDLGVSLVLSNNEKGDRWLAPVFSRPNVEAHETPFESTLRGNPRLIGGRHEIPPERAAFFEALGRLSFAELDRIYIQSVNRFKKPVV